MRLEPGELDRWPDDLSPRQVRAMMPAIEQSLQPATANEIALWVEFLRGRYQRRAEDTAVFADMDRMLWLQTLAHWPLDVLQAAVMGWLGADKPFPPKVPGELKAFGEPIMMERRKAKYRAERLLALPAPTKDDDAPRDASGMRDIARVVAAAKPLVFVQRDEARAHEKRVAGAKRAAAIAALKEAMAS